MSRGGLKITRNDEQGGSEVSQKDSSISGWMREFAASAEKYVTAEEQRQKEAVTVVNRSRENQKNIYDQMNAIMNGKRPLYSSVEEVVADYQQKTGLKTYLEKIQAESALKAAASQIISSASAEESEEEKKNSDITPKAFEVHPELETTIRSIVDNNPGIQIPAVLHTIGEIFSRKNLGTLLDDPTLSRYISKLLSEKPICIDTPLNLGRGVGLYDSDDGNKDPFSSLRPQSK